jgi:hypothetical protein
VAGMKRAFNAIVAAIFACALCAGPSLARAESVYVKYRGEVDLRAFDCDDITRSSFIRRVCYDQRNAYMLISLNGTYYHYCAIDSGTVSALLSASSMGQFYNANIKGNFDCRINQVPHSSAQPVAPANPNVYLPQSGSPGDHFGAIAFSTNSGLIGYSYNYGSGINAQNSAIHSCGYGDCTVVAVFTNTCGALAVGAGRRFGTGWAGTSEKAENIAMSDCSSRTTGCGVAQWACTTR